MENLFKKSLSKIKAKNFIIPTVITVLFLVLASLTLFKFIGIEKPTRQVYEAIDLGPQYTKVFSMVEDSISKSANIKISLPENVIPEEAKQKIIFTPKIDGIWLDSTNERELIFKPKQELKLGNYYSISLETPDGTIGEDFSIEEDPKILAVFPKADSEAHESSEITIVFNRPMVPLTTLDIMADQNIPVEITPATPGRFKWISTKNLQFIPEETLIPSANYSVRIKPEFSSLDGLQVNEFEHKFQTRKLRYRYVHSGNIVYNQPFRIAFNQSVDLEKTKQEIWLKNTDSDKRIDFIAEYGTQKIYNEKEDKYEDKEDRSVILIYAKNDKHGREKFWDFSTNYFLMVQKAHPLKGDIILNESRQVSFSSTRVIERIEAESERSNQVRQDLFDPQGKLWVYFYEDIDLSKSLINNDRISSSGYGEKCKDEEKEFRSDVPCAKETDKKKIYFIFNRNKLSLGEEFIINFEKIINSTGLTINKELIEETIKVIPKLQILRTIPADRSQGASLNELYLCSNSPLVASTKEDINNYLTLNNDHEFKNWNASILVPREAAIYYKCQENEFQTYIGYGLMPETDYVLDLKVIDHFNSQTTHNTGFRTGTMPSHDLSIYHFQEKFNVTIPGKTKLTYASMNMEYVDLHICQIDPEKMLNYVENGIDYRLAPNIATPECQEKIEKRIDLPKKYWIKNYFQIDLKEYFNDPFGHYVVTITNPNYRNWQGSQVYERSYVTITNLGVTKKQINIGEVESEEQKEKIKDIYWITDITSLASIENAKIEVYKKQDNNDNIFKSVEGLTGIEGIAEIQSDNRIVGAIVSKNNDSTIVVSDTNNFDWASTAYTAKKMYTYTDRPIYRPGDTVQIKGLYRIGYDGDYEIFGDNDINLKIRNSRNEEIFDQNLKVSDFGTWNTEYTIPTDAPVGQYGLQTEYGWTWFDVQEYAPAPFKVETKTDKEEYVSGDTFKLTVDASYYFGAPLEGGVIEYSIGSQDYHFDKYQDEYFNFGADWYYCYWDCSYGDKFILRNKVDIDKNGQAIISHDLNIDQMFTNEEERNSKIFVVYMTIKNSSGQSISTQKSFITHYGDFYLGIKTDQRFLAKNDKFTIKAKSIDTEGQPIKVENIDLTVNKVEWTRNKRKEVDGGYYYKWEKKLSPIKTDKFSTNDQGDWEKSFSIDDNGEFQIIIKARDKKGNEIKNTYDLYVYGDSWYDIRPSNDTSLEIIADKTDLNVGDTGSIIIKSPYEKARALISIERGRVFDYEIIDIDQSLFKYQFPIKEEYIPNLNVSATLLSGKPEIKHGSRSFRINTQEKELNIEVKSDKNFYLPGEEVKLEIEVKDKHGHGQETELSVAVADLSVLALKGNPKKDPLVFFYGNFPLTVSTVSNIKNMLQETDVPTGTKGGGGAEADDLAKKKRGEFKDTAFWQAQVITNSQGRASLKFTLPDNLTTWQIESVGITKDTKLGTDYLEFISRKELMVTPLKPRFIVPGDEFSIGAKIFNQSGKDQVLDIDLIDTSLELLENGHKKIIIDKDRSQTVYFKVKAPSNIDNGNHQFTLSAKNAKYEDLVEQSIKIVKNTTYETTATAGYSKKDQINEYVFLPENVVNDQGGLEIKTSATLAVFLSDALNSLLAYPYGCSEQIASKLEAVAVIKQGLNLENIGDKFQIKEVEMDGTSYTIDDLVDIGLKKIYATQKYDGGFGYYPQSSYSSFYLSLHIAQTLNDLKKAGYELNENAMKSLHNYLKAGIRQEDQYWEKTNIKEKRILTAYVLSELKEYGEIDQWLIKEISSLEKDKAYLNENIGNLALTSLAMLLAQEPELFNKNFRGQVFDVLENRINIDSRGAFLDIKENAFWEYYETPIKNTSLLLKALVKDKRDNALLDNIMRWLLRSRAKDGSWGSTNNTINVIGAMTDFLVWQEENKAEFDLKIELNREQQKIFNYSKANILDQNIFGFSIADLGLGKLNTVSFLKTDTNNRENTFYYDMSLKYYLPINAIPPRDEGFTITRGLYRLDDKYFESPVQAAEVGDVLKGHIEITLPESRNFVSIEDYIPAGVELINFDLATEDQQAIEGYSNEDLKKENPYSYWYDYYYSQWENTRKLQAEIKEIRDDRLFLYNERLNAGIYEYDYYVRVLVPGKFNVLPAMVNEMYFPENFGRTGGSWFVVNEKIEEQ